MKNNLTQLQRLHRLRQKSSSFNNTFSDQQYQIHLVQKLYTKNGFVLHLTCPLCPEQYDVFFAGQKVGYLRLRHGCFTVEHPDCFCDLILQEYPDGTGMFERYERIVFLTKALRAIQKRMKLNL